MISTLRSFRARADEVVTGDVIPLAGVVGVVTTVQHHGTHVVITAEAGMAGTVHETFDAGRALTVERNIYA